MNLTATVPAKYSPEQYKSLELWYDYLDKTYAEVRDLQFQHIPAESSRFAVFIDNRKHPYMEYVFRNIMHFLGKGWGFQIFVWPENRAFVDNIIKGWEHVHIVELTNRNFDGDAVDMTMRSSKFWSEVRGEKQLFFDLDSLLCRRGIEEFLKYDYIGAPWLESHAISPVCRFGSGGLSLRSKKSMMDICKNTNTRAQLIGQEGLFFSINMHLNNEKYCLPSVKTAEKFVVEGIYHPNPVGLHKPWLTLSTEQLNNLLCLIDYFNY